MILRTLVLTLYFCHAIAVNAEDKSPRGALTYNAFETLAFVAANKLFLHKEFPYLTYIPIHLDGQIKFTERVGLSFGLVYRYEDYQETGPLRSPSGRIRPTVIWTNYHEIFLLAGPRFSPLRTGLDGFYVALKAGLGGAFSVEYFALSFLIEPEVGYAFSFGNPGFALNLGAGLLGNIPFYETKQFAVPWASRRMKLGGVGIIVHHAIPIINVGIGFNW